MAITPNLPTFVVLENYSTSGGVDSKNKQHKTNKTPHPHNTNTSTNKQAKTKRFRVAEQMSQFDEGFNNNYLQSSDMIVTVISSTKPIWSSLTPSSGFKIIVKSSGNS